MGGQGIDLRRAARFVGVVALVACAATLLLRQVSVDTRWLVAWVAGTPWVLVIAGGALVAFVVARAWIGAGLATVAGLAIGATQLPLYLADDAPAGAAILTVMTANLQQGRADPAEVVRSVRQWGVDLLALQELTPDAEVALRDAGLERLLPHSVATPLEGASGNGLWSVDPLTARTTPERAGHPPVAAVVDLDGRAVFVACVHTSAPYPDGSKAWSEQLGRLARWFGDIRGPAIVAGDFNATHDHRQFREVLDSGLRDAAEQAGAGYVATYPTDRRGVPPMIAIDHVLVGTGLVATAVDAVDLPGSDHRAVIVDVAVAVAG